MLYENFKQGINLGGYLSQYELVVDAGSKEALKHHFETFITEADIRQIAAWGFDHVRIPVDGYLFYDPERKALNEEAMCYLDRCLEWCAAYKIHAVIDLHNIKGHVFGQMSVPSPLMTDAELQEDFYCFWREMAKHYKGYDKSRLLFELFNEMADATGYVWNRMYKNAVKDIRAVDRDRWILVGTNFVNSVGWLDRMDLVEDPCVFYNFHYYEPNVFTHQKAHFSEEFADRPDAYHHTLTYPGDMTAYIAFLKAHQRFREDHPLLSEETVCNDRVLMETLLSPAEVFQNYTGCELYCGEYGVIDSAPAEEAVKWIRDFNTICNEHRIGHAMWNYKCLDFELVDMEGQIVRPELVALLQEICN